MIDLNKEQKYKAKDEYELLKKLDSPFLIKLIGNDFEFDGFYCFLTEFYEVKIIISASLKKLHK